MKILRVFNNNAVLAATPTGEEVILTGKGLGFQAKTGQSVKTELIEQTFVPKVKDGSARLGEYLAEIAPENLSLALVAVDAVHDLMGPSLSIGQILALADHLAFAVRRTLEKKNVEYRLQSEVSFLYPDEYSMAQKIVALVNEKGNVNLSADEAVPVTLHLVSASFSSEGIAQSFQMTNALDEVIHIVETHVGVSLDRTSVDVARFITHLRYLYARLLEGDRDTKKHKTTRFNPGEVYPEAQLCAQEIARSLEARLAHLVHDDEVAYLTYHVARLAEALS